MNSFRTRGTCAREIKFEIENGIVTYVEFVGGCAGNTLGLARLCVGKTPKELVQTLKGIQCRAGTSCPDQLAIALEKYCE